MSYKFYLFLIILFISSFMYMTRFWDTLTRDPAGCIKNHPHFSIFSWHLCFRLKLRIAIQWIVPFYTETEIISNFRGTYCIASGNSSFLVLWHPTERKWGWRCWKKKLPYSYTWQMLNQANNLPSWPLTAFNHLFVTYPNMARKFVCEKFVRIRLAIGRLFTAVLWMITESHIFLLA